MDVESDPNSIYLNEQAEQLFNKKDLLVRIRDLLGLLNLRGVEIGLNVVSVEEMRRINHQYRDKDAATDVLSFALLEEVNEPLTSFSFPDKVADARKKGEDPVLLGDVVLSEEEVDFSSESRTRHTFHLIIHGILHLMGYNHDLGKDRKRMERIEQDCLEHLFGAS